MSRRPPLTKARGKKPRPVYPLALEAVRRIDALFAIERDINGLQRRPSAWPSARQRSAPLVAELRPGCSRHAPSSRAATIWPRP